MTVPDESFIPYAGGDPGRARLIRRSLERLRESADPELRRLAEDVLSGKRNFRDIPKDPAFQQGFQRVGTPFFEAWNSMSSEEQRDAASAGRAHVEQYRTEMAREAEQRRREAAETADADATSDAACAAGAQDESAGSAPTSRDEGSERRTGRPPATDIWERLGIDPPDDL